MDFVNKRDYRVTLPDDLLMSVEKPARYTGNEWNAITVEPRNNAEASRTGAHNDDTSRADGDTSDRVGSVCACAVADVRFAFCFPDIYELGMSHLGLRIIYDAINRRAGVSCERVFAPWRDMEQKMRERGIPLFALESRDALTAFDFLGFSLQYELSYTTVLNMLDLAGLSPLADERGDDAPLVCAGGPCVCNPAPMSRFMDFFVLGEGEEVIHVILDLYSEMKNSNNYRSADARRPGCIPKGEFLRELSKIDGVYVPSIHGTASREIPSRRSALSGGAAGGSDSVEGSFPRIKKRVIDDLDNVVFPERGIVPGIGVVHDRIVLEVLRGCIRGCRFCQAGYIYRPVREKSHETLISQACALVASTGYDEIALSSLSTSDYTELTELTDRLIPEMAPRRVNISLPSLRVDSFSLELANSASNVRKSGLTFAPEAGTQRLRDVINKGITEADILRAASLAFHAGFTGLKLYFMIGLPTETYEDLDGISDLVKSLVHEFHKVPKEHRGGKGLNVSVSVSSFVPKPFTPFQWEPQDDTETLEKKQRYLLDIFRRMRGVTLHWHDADTSFMEAVLARGDEGVGASIYEAWKDGANLEGWNENFSRARWETAFQKSGASPADYANRRRETNERLPWDILDYGVTKEFLIRERERAYMGALTPNCREACSNCGVREAFGCGL